MQTEEQILMPPRHRTWTDGDWHLYFDPHNFVWVRVNDSGKFLFEQFAKYKPVADVVSKVSETFGLPEEEAKEGVERFVEQMVDAEFLHRGEYKEKDQTVFHEREFAHAIYLHLTNECNLKCPYCYNKSDRDYKVMMEKKGMWRPSLSTQEYKDFISRTIELGVNHFFFTGGEPLMRPDVFELIAHARSEREDMMIEVLTNAILIKEPVAEQLCDLVDMVTISMDGHERHLHEHYRGKNTFAPTIRGIRTLVEVRNRRGQDKPNIAIVPALTDKNIGFMKEIFEFSLDDLGADFLAPILFQPGDHQELSLQQIPELEEWQAARRRTMEYYAEREERTGQSSRPSVLPPALSKRTHCGVGNGEFSIDASGYIYPCQTLHFDEFQCGNIRDNDILDIFQNSPVMRRVRGTDVDSLAVCRHCDVKHLCNGGCRATAYNVYRHFDAHNEVYCRHLEEMARNKLWTNCSKPLAVTGDGCP